MLSNEGLLLLRILYARFNNAFIGLVYFPDGNEGVEMSWPYTKLPSISKFEIYKDSTGKYRFRLKAANNEIIAVSEAYESRTSCENGVRAVQSSASKAEIVDTTQ